jgi:predicted dehydrogenase
MAKQSIRVAVIGCGGNMQRAHLPRFEADGGIEIVCVSDTIKENADDLLDAWGKDAVYYEDYNKMIRGEDMEAVVISSPHSLHYEHARLGLQKGCHVMCEKPLTVSSRHTKSLIALADKRKCYIQVGYQRHYMREYMHARQLIRDGVIGEIRGVVGYVTQNWGNARGWRLDPELSGGGMFMDTGSHLVAVLLWLTGLEPAEVTAFLTTAGKPVDINTVVSVRFKGSALGTINTFGDAKAHDERVAIHGSEGSLVFHLHKWGVKSLLLNDEPVKIPASVKETTPDEVFFDWIRNDGQGYSPPDYALQVSRLSEAVYKAVAGKKPVRVAR